MTKHNRSFIVHNARKIQRKDGTKEGLNKGRMEEERRSVTAVLHEKNDVPQPQPQQ